MILLKLLFIGFAIFQPVLTLHANFKQQFFHAVPKISLIASCAIWGYHAHLKAKSLLNYQTSRMTLSAFMDERLDHQLHLDVNKGLRDRKVLSHDQPDIPILGGEGFSTVGDTYITVDRNHQSNSCAIDHEASHFMNKDCYWRIAIKATATIASWPILTYLAHKKFNYSPLIRSGSFLFLAMISPKIGEFAKYLYDCRAEHRADLDSIKSAQTATSLEQQAQHFLKKELQITDSRKKVITSLVTSPDGRVIFQNMPRLTQLFNNLPRNTKSSVFPLFCYLQDLADIHKPSRTRAELFFSAAEAFKQKQ